MLISLIPNEKLNIDKVIDLNLYDNTLGIKSISPVKVNGIIYVSYTTIEYDLTIETTIELEDLNNHCNKKQNLLFKIEDIDENSQENLHISEKTLDLNAKIWENIVVEILSEPSGYDTALTSGDGWVLYQEEHDNNEVDERLKPLLDLLNTNEEV